MCLDCWQNCFWSSFVNILVGRSISEGTLKIGPDDRIHFPPCESGFTSPLWIRIHIPPCESCSPKMKFWNFLKELDICENFSKIESHFTCRRAPCESCTHNHGKSVGNQAKSVKIKAKSSKILEKPSKFNEIQRNSIKSTQNEWKSIKNESKSMKTKIIQWNYATLWCSTIRSCICALSHRGIVWQTKPVLVKFALKVRLLMNLTWFSTKNSPFYL